MTLDPDQVAVDQEACERASALAALVAHYYEALRDLKLPESLCVQVTADWHSQVISDVVVWEEDDTD
jgi:hypothetical protein